MNSSDIISFEELCTAMYNTDDIAKQHDASIRVQNITSSPDFINKSQVIIENSKNTYALYITISSITTLLTTFWNNYTVDQKKEMRDFVLKFIDIYGSQLPNYIISAASKFIGRVTKLLWSVDITDRNIQNEMSDFMSHGSDHTALGLTILADTVREMNAILPGQQRTNYRKIAISFRDTALFEMLTHAFTILTNIYTNTLVIEDESLKQKTYNAAIDLIVTCFNYDFIGASSDDTSEEISTIHIPAKWDTFITQSSNIELLYQIYDVSDSDTCKLVFDSILCLVSIRRSIFLSSEQRITYLTSIMNGLTHIMNTKRYLNYSNIYNIFCQICSRLKANFQLSELVKVQVYPEFIQLLTQFTLTTFKEWENYSNSLPYLLVFWTRMVCAERYVSSDSMTQQTENYLSTSIPTIFQAYIEGKLLTVESYVDDELNDPLTSSESLMSEMQQLPSIMRYQYNINFTYLINMFDDLFNQYSECLRTINLVLSSNTEEFSKVKYKLNVLENKLTWLVYVISSVITGQMFQESQNEEKQEELDGELCKRVFILIKNTDYRHTQYNNIDIHVDFRLEIAILTFLDSFKRTFITQQQTTVGSSNSLFNDGISSKYQYIAHMFQIIGQGDPTNILNLIITKLSANLKNWPNNIKILKQSLLLLQNLISTYNTNKVLLKLPAVEFLLQHHNSESYSFLSSPSAASLRTIYYNILTHLVLYDSNPSRLELFLFPLIQTAKQMNSKTEQELQDLQVAYNAVCLYRDVRGVIDAPLNKAPYCIIFNKMYPDLFELAIKLLNIYWNNSDINSIILKTISSFSLNKGSRIDFGSSSPNNILLFRVASQAITLVGNNILKEYLFNNTFPEPIFKPLRYVFDIVERALSGSYIPFGVFALYNDQCLNTALATIIQIIINLPYDTLLQYPKCALSVFSLIDVLFMNHMRTISSLDQHQFMTIINYLTQGIESFNTDIVGKATSSIDHLATYIYMNNNNNEDSILISIKNHISQVPSFWLVIYKSLFNSLLFGDKAIHWYLSRPLLSITIIQPKVVLEYNNTFIQSQPTSIQQKLSQSLQQLKPAENNLESSTRDSYSVAISLFKQEVLDYIVL